LLEAFARERKGGWWGVTEEEEEGEDRERLGGMRECVRERERALS
jgi:hypothetical protein